MRVLMLGWELPPHNSGGLGVACYHLCKALVQHGVDIEFIVPYTADHGIDFMRVTAALPHDVTAVTKSGAAYDSHLYTYANGITRHISLHGQQQMYMQAVEQLVEEHTYDVIHAHDWMTLRAALRAKELMGVPVIAHIHSIEADRAGGQIGNPLVREIEQLSLLAADHIVAVSDFTKRAIMREYGIPGAHISVIYNSFEPSDVVPLEQPHATTYRYLQTLQTQGWKVITYVGRLTIQKGLSNLLRAAQMVVAHEPKTMFLITGGGEQYQELIRLSADLGIAKNVLFTGFLRGKPWRDAFAVGDLFVMPSISEPFGLVALESVAYGTPALITKQSGVAEALHSALKVDFWDVDEMANQIIAAVRHTPLRRELQQNALREINRLSWRDTAQAFIRLYRKHRVVHAA